MTAARLFSAALLPVTISLLVALQIAGGKPCRAQEGTGDRSFTFLDFSDTHQTASGDNQGLKNLVASALAMDPRPAFAVDCGDITESGRPEEYARFKEGIDGLQQAGIAFYAAPGNDDVRWCPEGKQGFVRQFGRLYQSFDYHGVHFIILDTTVMLEHFGHVDRHELDWLRADLKHVRSTTPIFVFMHHWIGRDPPDTRMIDNEFDVDHALAGHNVLAIFVGHGHQDLVWRTNGILTLMARGLYQGSWYQVSVSPLIVRIDRVEKEEPDKPVHIADIPISPGESSSHLQAAWDDPDVPYLARRRPAARLEPRAIADVPDHETAKYRIDDGAWKPLTRSARNVWRDQFLTAGMQIGIHACDIALTTSNQITLEDELIFEVERDVNEPNRRWAVDLDGAIQSSPTLDNGILYVSSNDHHVYAFNAKTGRRLWVFATKGAVLSSPVIRGDSLYIGSTDGFVYALHAQNGRLKWKYDAGAPVFGSAAVAAGVVCIGGDHEIIGLDAERGTLRWRQAAGAFFQSRAATNGTLFFLGGWDNTFYALNCQTGTIAWTRHIGRLFYFSPAISSPAVSGDAVYVCSDDGDLHAMNVDTGAELWTTSAPTGGDTLGYSSPVVAGQAIVVGGLGANGNVYAFNRVTGAPLWTGAIGQTIYDSSPALSPDGTSFAIMGVRGQVAVVSTATGRLQWTYNLGPGNIFSTPAWDGTAVYTCTMADDVQAINAPILGPVKNG
ncbi:MAG: PQQ-binding-like beta-propeller repeat protein [Armatimonadetes bacterium]|nr:PQQ-binding-like beta-propeller repeat protein [Armatimonadota bacterium]MDE2206769.1 PQQ-binding-like beta-propeller repeat protein [Armatimonadota bacterium]